MIILAKYVHLLALVVWIGSIVFFSFIGAPAIFKALDRKTAGDVVGLIFPKYYVIGYVCSLLSLATLWVFGGNTGFTGAMKGGLAALLVMTALAFGSGLVVAPKVVEVKYQIRAETDEAKIEGLRKQFGKLHGISMMLNAATLVAGLILLFFTVRYFSGE